MATPPTLAEVKVYLGLDADDTSRDAAIEQALAAEIINQQRAVRRTAYPDSPAPYPADLAEALYRRVARNLALRAIPLAVLQSDAEGGSLVMPGTDPERRRLEAPWRKLPVG